MHAAEPGTSRLARTLTGRSEMHRIRTLSPFINDPTKTLENLDDLRYALDQHVEQLTESRAVSESTIVLIDLIASTKNDDANFQLIELLDSERSELVMACADALGKNRAIEALDNLKRLVERPEWKTKYGYRFGLVRTLINLEHPDAYEFLTHIQKSVDGQLRHELNEAMKKVTLDDFLGDEERYEAWRDEGKQRESMFKSASYSESANRIKLQPQQYYGIDINAKRVMFVIDHSGSMKARTYGGTRLTRAKQELIKAIKDMPNDHEFAIVFYETNVRKWREELVYASEENKMDAVQFVSRLGYGKSTNTHGALKTAMEFDESLEAVFLLTDGIPTCGDIVPPQGIINDVVRRNRLRHLTVNAIGIAVNGPTEKFLSTLSKLCNGQFRKTTE